jgi:ABC-type Zn uptake system ZnuABC Zn-binding protein ZnuA
MDMASHLVRLLAPASRAVVALLLLATPVAANAQAGDAASPRPLTGAVSIAPLHGLLEPLIAAANGSSADTPSAAKTESPVSILIPPGRSEHGYEAPPSRLTRMRDADVVVLVGLGLEPQAEKFLAEHPPADGRSRRLIRFADVLGIDFDPHDHHHHDHAPGEPCTHEGPDPHLWLDPVMVERLVDAMTREVRAIAPDAAARARVDAAGQQLRQQVRAVHEEYALACGQFHTKVFVVGHDAWRRLCERYGLSTVAIAGLTATEPTPKALEQAKQAVREHRLNAVFAEPQLSDRAARRIAEACKVEIRRLDPLGQGDWFAMMRGNLAELQRTLGAAAGSPAAPTGTTDGGR